MPRPQRRIQPHLEAGDSVQIWPGLPGQHPLQRDMTDTAVGCDIAKRPARHRIAEVHHEPSRDLPKWIQ